jgi:hypothetical protein
VLIILTAAILTIFSLTRVNGDTETSLGASEAFWQSLTRVLDPGTFSGDVNWPTRIAGRSSRSAGSSSPAASSRARPGVHRPVRSRRLLDRAP